MRAWLAALVLLSLAARPAAAHPAPFSFLDIRLSADRVTGTLVVHNLDAAHDLGVADAETLLDRATATAMRDRLVALLAPRVALAFDGRAVELRWLDVAVIPDRQSLSLGFTAPGGRVGLVSVYADVFPYDPVHQTFVNLYEADELTRQAILDGRRRALDHYTGGARGRWAVVRTFVASGVEHILIGPDHVLFLVGLLLLGGSATRLALIVTAFTLGHSVTLSLASLDVVSPPARIVEPLIALTIIVVGADNLLVLRGEQARTTLTRPADIRAGLAAAFGLVHGFGFASVLKEFGLPSEALVWSLFAFNLGVEVGQLAIVLVVAGALAWLARAQPRWSRHAVFAGSIAVILAGAYWFVERTF